jgi:MerR family transcriptional regulator, copper efflux regulator
VPASGMQSLTIGEIAKAAQIGVETVRFYEREGLIAEPPRRRSGYRQYPPNTVRRLRFIRRAKELGFTLKEIGELLDLRVDPAKSCADMRALANAKIADVEAKMSDLAQIQAALEKLARACRGKGPTSESAILDALDDQEDGHGNEGAVEVGQPFPLARLDEHVGRGEDDVFLQSGDRGR